MSEVSQLLKVKRPLGRPPGSKNKKPKDKKDAKDAKDAKDVKAPAKKGTGKGPGRPFGSKNKIKDPLLIMAPKIKGRIGRPPGSKNKKKSSNEVKLDAPTR